MMAQDNGELFTFSTSSRGGHGAVGDLARLYARHRRKQPDELPIVGLGIRVYEHREYGRIRIRPSRSAAGNRRINSMPR